MNTLLTFCGATLVLAASPGPDNIFVLTLSIARGFRTAFWVVAGLLTGCVFHTTLLAIGMAAVIDRYPVLFETIKFLGAFYLLYLALKVFKASSDLNLDSEQVKEGNAIQLFKTGLTMNLLNPKVAIFFLAFFPGFLFNSSLPNWVQFYVLGALFILISAMVFLTIALLASNLRKFLMQVQWIGVFFKYLQIVVFVGISLFIVFSD